MGLIFISVVQNRINEFGTIVDFFMTESKLLPFTQIISLPNNCSNSINAIKVLSFSAVAIKSLPILFDTNFINDSSFGLHLTSSIVTKEKIDPITNKPLEKSTFDNILNYVKYFSIIVFLGSLGFNGYMYFIVYLPQYYKWFKMLPDAAKAELITINTLNSVIEHARQNPTHGTLGLGNGLINIRL